jgi:hypothetical protein
VKWAFVERKCDEEIRDFIVDMSLAYIEPGWFKNESKDWPEAFVSELADVVMVRWRDRKDDRALRKMWMRKLNVETDVVSDDEVTAPSGGEKGPASTAATIGRDNHRAADLDRATSGATRPPVKRKHSSQTVEVTKCRPKQDPRIVFLSDDSEDSELLVLRPGR